MSSSTFSFATGTFSMGTVENLLDKPLDEIIKERKKTTSLPKRGPKRAPVAASKSKIQKEKSLALQKQASLKRQAIVNQMRGLGSGAKPTMKQLKKAGKFPKRQIVVKGKPAIGKQSLKVNKRPSAALIGKKGKRTKLSEAPSRSRKIAGNKSRDITAPSKFQLPKGAKMNITVDLGKVKPAPNTKKPKPQSRPDLNERKPDKKRRHTKSKQFEKQQKTPAKKSRRGGKDTKATITATRKNFESLKVAGRNSGANMFKSQNGKSRRVSIRNNTP